MGNNGESRTSLTPASLMKVTGVHGPVRQGVVEAPNPHFKGNTLSDVVRGFTAQGPLHPMSTIPEENETFERQSRIDYTDNDLRRSGCGPIRTRQSISPPIETNLGKIVETKGLTAARSQIRKPAPKTGDKADGKSWSFFWKNSTQKVIDKNRQAAVEEARAIVERYNTKEREGKISKPVTKTEAELQLKVLGAFLSSNRRPIPGANLPSRTMSSGNLGKPIRKPVEGAPKNSDSSQKENKTEPFNKNQPSFPVPQRSEERL